MNFFEMWQVLKAGSFSDTTIYYFYSTGSQSIAAVTGIFATFLIFRYQVLASGSDSQAKKTWGGYRQFFSWLFSKEQLQALESCITDHERLHEIREYNDKYLSASGKADLTRQMESRFNPTNDPTKKDAIDSQIRLYADWKLELDHYFGIVRTMRHLRFLAVVIVIVGLVLVIWGLLGIASVRLDPASSIGGAPASLTRGDLKVFIEAVVIYGIVMAGTTLVAFWRPWKR